MEMLYGVDWVIFVNAVRAFVHGHNPYLVGSGYNYVYNPFWTYIFLAPFAILPFWVGRILWFFASFIGMAYTGIRLGATKFQLILFMTSAAVIGGFYFGNIDALVLSGLWMPPWIGLFFVMMKPQLGVGIALYWMYNAWHKGKWMAVFKLLYPVVTAYLLSFAIYGFWIQGMFKMPDNPANVKLFPYLLPLGMFILYLALQRMDSKLAIFSSPLFAPYVTRFNLSITLLALFEYPSLFIFAWIATWIPVVAFALVG